MIEIRVRVSGPGVRNMRRLADLPLHTQNPLENSHNSEFFPPHDSAAKSPFVVATYFFAEKAPVCWMTEKDNNKQLAWLHLCHFGVTAYKPNTYSYTTREAAATGNLFSHEFELHGPQSRETEKILKFSLTRVWTV